MEYFVDHNGRYEFRGGSGLELQRKIITAVIIASGLIVLGVSVFVYSMMKKHGGLEQNPVLPFAPMLSFPVTLVILLFVRRRLSAAGRITVDYMNGKMSFGGQAGNSFGRVEVATAEIRRIILSREASGATGTVWSISVVTPSGRRQVMVDGREDRARGVAGELASLISCPVDDITRD